MPNTIVKIPSGAFGAAARARLVEGIDRTAAQVERIPDDPKKRFLSWVVIEDVAAGSWTCGGADVTAAMIPVIVLVNLPVGVLSQAARAQYVEGVHRAVIAALPGEQRRIMTSCILNEVADGAWGANGAIWHLPDFAAHGGYEHLQHLVKSAA